MYRTCASDVGLSESALPKDEIGDDDQRSWEPTGGSRPFIQPAGDSTTSANGGPIAPSVVISVRRVRQENDRGDTDGRTWRIKHSKPHETTKQKTLIVGEETARANRDGCFCKT